MGAKHVVLHRTATLLLRVSDSADASHNGNRALRRNDSGQRFAIAWNRTASAGGFRGDRSVKSPEDDWIPSGRYVRGSAAGLKGRGVLLQHLFPREVVVVGAGCGACPGFSPT